MQRRKKGKMIMNKVKKDKKKETLKVIYTSLKKKT